MLSVAAREVEREPVADPARVVDEGALGGRLLAVDGRPRSGAEADADVGVVGLDHHEDRLVVDGGLLDVREMAVGQLPIAWDARVDDVAVDPRADVQASGPVLRDDRGVEAGDARVVHRDEPPLDERRLMSAASEADVTREGARSKIELLPVRDQFDRANIEPIPTPDPEREREPVGKVDELLVLDLATLQ